MTDTNNIAANTTISVPFNKLVADPANVRQSRPSDDIESLANNIEAEGLLQNLVVRKVSGGKYAVLAGERRRQALALLVKNKTLKASTPIPCKLITDESATSASLAENIHRNAMHPSDQFAAWVALAEQGMCVDDIATRHGATTQLIQKRLKLGRLSPVLLDALRTDAIGVEIASAFTLTDNHDTQESVYRSLCEQHALSVHRIRRALTESEISSKDKLAILVGKEAYVDAGGEIRTDLFDEEHFFQNAELLHTLASERLKQESRSLHAEGWHWVEFFFDYDHAWGTGMRRVSQHPAPLSEADTAALESLQNRLAQFDELDESDIELTPEQDIEYEEAQEAIEVIEAKAHAYLDEDKAFSGGYVYLDRSGAIHHQLGWVRPEHDPLKKQAKTESDSTASNGEPDTPSHALSKSLRDDLAAIRLEILRSELLTQPALTADLLAFHTVRTALAQFYIETPFNLEARQGSGGRYESAHGDMGNIQCRESYAQRVAELSLAWFEITDVLESFKAFLALSSDEKAALLAYVAVLLLRPQLSDDTHTEPTLEHVAALAGVDAAKHWTPDAGFFSRIKVSAAANPRLPFSSGPRHCLKSTPYFCRCDVPRQ